VWFDIKKPGKAVKALRARIKKENKVVDSAFMAKSLASQEKAKIVKEFK
jgi:hypothetical protein